MNQADQVDPDIVIEPNGDTISPSFEDFQQRAADGLERVRQWVHDNPIPALGIALTAGFVVGRIVRR